MSCITLTRGRSVAFGRSRPSWPTVPPWQRMAGEISERLGVVDVLVNNAGVAGGAGEHTILEIDEELWYRTVDANLNAVYVVTKALPGGMVQAGRGAIVNISSVAGRAGQPRMGAYVATKFALVGLTQQLALEFAPAVRVNCICPGSTDTDMMDGTFARRDAVAGAPPDDAAWITGQTLNVDGGQRMD